MLDTKLNIDAANHHGLAARKLVVCSNNLCLPLPNCCSWKEWARPHQTLLLAPSLTKHIGSKPHRLQPRKTLDVCTLVPRELYQARPSGFPILSSLTPHSSVEAVGISLAKVVGPSFLVRPTSQYNFPHRVGWTRSFGVIQGAKIFPMVDCRAGRSTRPRPNPKLYQYRKHKVRCQTGYFFLETRAWEPRSFQNVRIYCLVAHHLYIGELEMCQLRALPSGAMAKAKARPFPDVFVHFGTLAALRCTPPRPHILQFAEYTTATWTSTQWFVVPCLSCFCTY